MFPDIWPLALNNKLNHDRNFSICYQVSCLFIPTHDLAKVQCRWVCWSHIKSNSAYELRRPALVLVDERTLAQSIMKAILDVADVHSRSNLGFYLVRFLSGQRHTGSIWYRNR